MTKSLIDKDAPVVRMVMKTTPGVRARDAFTAVQINTRSLYNDYAYDAAIDPMKLYDVDPSEITQATKPFSGPKRTVAGKVIGGAWDLRTRPFSELDGRMHFHVYDSFEQHFEDGIPWEETEYYERLMTAVQNGNHRWGCTSRQDVIERFEKIDELYEWIRLEGYKTQSELLESQTPSPIETPSRPEIFRKINNEIAINIGRDGDLMFYDGRNRLAIAKILELDRIPVVILARHKKWQRTRDRVVRGNFDPGKLSEQLRTHPDIEDLL